MRTPQEYDTADGKRFKVRYRSGGKQTSATFRRKPDAKTFASLLASGPDGVAEAHAWLAARERGDVTPTFGEHFERYVDQLTGVTERTRADYRAQHRRYLTELDPIMLPLLTRAHVTDVVNRLDRAGKSPKTIKNVIHMLSSCLALAMDEGHIARNPCRRVRLPKRSLGDKEAHFLTREEFLALLEHIPEHYKPLVYTIAGTGMRWSEVTALEGQHLRGDRLLVTQAWKRVPGGWEMGVTKTGKSKRTIMLGADVAEMLAPLAHRGQLIFRTPYGHPVRHSNFFNRIWKPACAAARLDPAPGLHSIRHSHVAWLIAEGVSLPVIQARLGHENITTTIDTYGHLLPDVQAAAASAAERVFGGTPARALRG